MIAKRILVPAFVALSLTLTTDINAQTSMVSADKQYEMGLYESAAKSYRSMVESDKKEVSYEVYDKLAKCYVYMNRPTEAIQVFESASLKFDMPASAYIDWASALKKIGHDDEANDLISFASIKEGVDFKEIQLPEVQSYIVRHLDLNTEHDEFAPAYQGKQLVFVSNTSGVQRAKQVAHEAKADRFELFKASGEATSRQPLHMIFNESAQEGAVSYAPDGQWVAYTQVNIPKDQSPKISNGKSGTLYLAEIKEDGSWNRRIALPCNDVGVANVYPHFSEDGKYLYFASNRSGGHGGYDLYRIKRIGDGWSSPENLGPEVNGPQDEISPYTSGGELFFSSNRIQGAGGYDLYGYDMEDKTAVYNLGAQLNSSYDDYAMITQDAGKSGYFTSNRPGGRGGEDILSFHRINAAPSAQKTASAIQLKNEQPTVRAQPTLAISADKTSSEVTYSASAEPTKLVSGQDDVPVLRVASADADPERILTIFTIQVAAYREQNTNYKRIASKLRDLGFVYRVYYHDLVKIRVGQFDAETEARATLIKVKDRGFKDAFVVREELMREDASSTKTSVTNTSSSVTAPAPTSDVRASTTTSSQSTTTAKPSTAKEEYVVPETKVAQAPTPAPKPAPSSMVKEAVKQAAVSDERIEKIKAQVTRYRIKLGSYTNMSMFDSEKVKRYGSLFEEERGEFTMVFLGDYMTLEDAQAIRTQIQSEGFGKAIIYGVAGDQLVKIN